MIDLASYMTMTYQYETLRQELERFSEPLCGRAFAIALTRVDALAKEEAEAKVMEMMGLLELTPSQRSRFGFDDALPFFEQDVSDERRAFDKNLPFFMVPISSVAHENIKPLNYALYTLVGMEAK